MRRARGRRFGWCSRCFFLRRSSSIPARRWRTHWRTRWLRGWWWRGGCIRQSWGGARGLLRFVAVCWSSRGMILRCWLRLRCSCCSHVRRAGCAGRCSLRARCHLFFGARLRSFTTARRGRIARMQSSTTACRLRSHSPHLKCIFATSSSTTR